MNTKPEGEAQETLIAVIPKNGREEMRVSLGEFKGYPLCTFRVWYRDADGTMKPSKAGVAFRVELLRDVSEAFHVAIEHARRDGRL